MTKYPAASKPSSSAELSSYCQKIDMYVFSWAHYALGSIESARAKVGWSAFVHTAQPVITLAVGPGEEEFRGEFDNTDMAKKMAKLLGLKLSR